MVRMVDEQGKIKVFLRNMTGVNIRDLLGKYNPFNRDDKGSQNVESFQLPVLTLDHESLRRYSADETWFEVIDHQLNTYYVVIPP